LEGKTHPCTGGQYSYTMSLPGVLIVGGFGVWGIASVVGLLESRARSSWKRTQGKVVDQVRKKNSAGRTQYHHVIGFTTDSGESVNLDPVVTRFQYYTLGQSVLVLFDPADARRAVLDQFPFRWSARISWLIVIGFALLFMGALILD
jgi:uncharacterized protein DUF3592